MITESEKVERLQENEDNYDRLMAVIEASQGMLALLIVCCDQRAFREEVIQRYETELSPEISCYRVSLDPDEPSLRAALAALVEENPSLEQARMMVTVTGISELMDIRLKEPEEKSPLERFFGYLQWTREGLRAFPFPIILWVTPGILKQMSLAAPDFWSWRTGVFRFVAPQSVSVPTDREHLPVIVTDRARESNLTLPIAELQKQIGQIQAQNAHSPALAVLYDRLGQAYHERICSGKSHNLSADISQAIVSFEQAIDLQRELNLKSDLGNSLIRLGYLYYCLSQYQQAEKSYQQALEITREIGDRLQEATAINGLGNVYRVLGKYQQAIAFHQQQLNIAREIGDRQREANALGNLGLVYNSLGEYKRAIAFYQQSLDIAREIGDRQREANALGNLGNVYKNLGEYQRVIAFYQQSLDIARKIGDRQGEANALGCLGNVYKNLGEYQRAITFHQQSLDIARKIGDRQGEATAWFNLGLALKKLQREVNALEAFHNARQLYQAMELDSKVQDCDNQINALSNLNSP